MANVKIISLGGSIVAPQEADIPFLKQFREAVNAYLDEDRERELIFIVGGGGPARSYQRAYRELTENQAETEQQDWIGIAATRLNGELIRGLFLKRCPSPVITNPHEVPVFSGTIMVVAGWKPEIGRAHV